MESTLAFVNGVFVKPSLHQVIPHTIQSSRALHHTHKHILQTSSIRVSISMMADKKDEPRSDGYVIKQSEFVDAGGDDDSGDGFMGESAMDDMLGLSMPDDLAGFERNEIMNAKSREELVDKLKDIASRRKDIRADRRKGIGMDNVNNYLGNL